MSSETVSIAYCEHDEVQVACLECLAMPKKVVPPPSPTPRATKSPSSVKDKISPLGGSLDMSMPAAKIQDLVGSETLPARAFPHYLRKSGWIYLRSEDHLEARVKAGKLVWQEQRFDLAEPDRELGPGLAIQVDASTWDSNVQIDLGRQAVNQRDGYRYLVTNEDNTVTHYRGGRPIVELSEEELEAAESDD